jgi:putative transposon-encoded protein
MYFLNSPIFSINKAFSAFSTDCWQKNADSLYLLFLKRIFAVSKSSFAFDEKKVTPFGTGAKVDCPKEYLGRKVYLVIKR